MTYQQLVSPRLGTRDGTGWCLRFVQSVYNAPVAHNSAWDAWNATTKKHRNRNLPNASVPVWFEHWGTYGSPPTWGNWGHVVAYVPGRGYLSSPAGGFGQQWFSSIGAVERAFNAKFVGWSEDLNGLSIVKSAGGSKPTGKGLTVIHYAKQDKDARGKGRTLKPGNHIYLNTTSGGPSNASNIVGGIGPYSITAHLYATGTPGDVLGIKLVWVDPKGKRSSHYNQHVSFDKDGLIRENVEFKRYVSRGYRVFLQVTASSKNQGSSKVTLLDSDAYLIK